VKVGQRSLQLVHVPYIQLYAAVLRPGFGQKSPTFFCREPVCGPGGRSPGCRMEFGHYVAVLLVADDYLIWPRVSLFYITC